MSTSINLHHVAHISIHNLTPHPGCIIVKLVDKDGNDVTVFADDAMLRKLAVELQRYAGTRETPPVDPKPTYAEALFAPVAVPDDGDNTIPF